MNAKHLGNDFLTQLFRDEGFEYALFDEKTRLVDFSSGLSRYLISPPDGNQKGHLIGQLFPEFIGYEDRIKNLLDGSLPELTLERIHRNALNNGEGYISLRLRSNQSGVLLIVRDVTIEGQLEQKVTQQRNELRLQNIALQRIEERLRLINDQLEVRVTERTAELQEALHRLQGLSKRLVQVQESERRAIARELHDEIGQALTGLKLVLGMSARSLPEEAQASLDDAQVIVVELMNRVRQISLELRPAMLDDLGLVPALLWHFDRYTHQTGVHVDFKHTKMDRRFKSDVETAAYRIIQEALTNTARYAKIDLVRVRLWVYGDVLILRIEDQGVGFDLGNTMSTASSNGLSGMQERASLLDGNLVIESTPGKGTQITAELPIIEEILNS